MPYDDEMEIFPPELYVPEENNEVETEGIREAYADLDFAYDGETIAVYKFDRVMNVKVSRTLEEPEPEDPT